MTLDLSHTLAGLVILITSGAMGLLFLFCLLAPMDSEPDPEEKDSIWSDQ